MKWTVLLVLAGMLSVLASDDLEINGKFRGSRPGDVAPKMWMKNWLDMPAIGESRMVPGGKAGKMILKVKTTSQETPFYSRECIAGAGDVLEIEAEVTGAGSFRLGYYAYDAQKAYLETVLGPKIAVRPREDEYKTRLTVKNFPGRGPTAMIRVVISVLPGSELAVSEMEAEFDDED